MSSDRVWVPLLNVGFLNDTASACVTSVCGGQATVFAGVLQCNVEPYLVEGNIYNATSHAVCPKNRDEYITFIRMTSVVVGFGDNIGYEGRCSFTKEACAKQVCGLQNTRINTTKNNEFLCKSDPAVAGTYWFDLKNANNNMSAPVTNDTSAPCRGEKPNCWGLKYVNANGTTVTSGTTHSVPTPLALLAVATGLLGLLGACGLSVA
ncbi:hypothetical protein Q8F55_004440 [Vanrija albida]|uniref:Uncharacterized protein n=1 Tax=Vanrija albida TaxID=181172 RepID=A0ABR3Q6R3_9TREE